MPMPLQVGEKTDVYIVARYWPLQGYGGEYHFQDRKAALEKAAEMREQATGVEKQVHVRRFIVERID